MSHKLFTLLTAVLIALSLLQSCKKEPDTTSPEIQYIETEDILPTTEEIPEYIPEDKEVSFPKSGNTIADFVPKNSKYEVIDELKIDINKDGLQDIIVLLFHKNDPDASRPVLVLLQNEDQSYRLDAMSRVAIASTYTNESNPYSSNIESISNGTFNANFRIPNGYFESTYVYQNNKLVIAEIFSGVAAGNQTVEYKYYPLTGKIETIKTTYLEDNEKSSSYADFTTDPRILYFDKDNPREDYYTNDSLPYL